MIKTLILAVSVLMGTLLIQVSNVGNLSKIALPSALIERPRTVAKMPVGVATTQDVIDAANAFKATLSTTQIASCFLSYSLTDAVKWSNFPIGIYANRVGIKLSALSTTQLAAAKNLLVVASGTGVEGNTELEGLLAADDYLGANGGGTQYTAGNYYIALLGTPDMSGTWALSFGGHHLAFANTYKAGVLAGATPSFRGVEPFASFSQNGGTYQPLIEEKNALAAIHASLSTTQRNAAQLASSYNDIVLGPQKDWQFPTTKLGLKCSNLDATQKALVLAAIRTYVADIDATNANSFMTKYTNEIDNTYVGFSGGGTMTAQGDYMRIDGPSVWIEYSSQGGIVIRSVTHPHSVWRDRSTDYGGTGNPIPVELVDFTAKFAQKEQKTMLEWQVENEDRIGSYTVQRSADAKQFDNLGEVMAKNGPLSKNYFFEDSKPLQNVNYYRLKINEQDGSSRFSKIQSVLVSTKEWATVTPNPTTGSLKINTADPVECAQIFDIKGQLLRTFKNGGREFDVSDLPNGVYALAIKSNGRMAFSKLIKL